MIEMTEEVRAWIKESANEIQLEAGEYIDSEDGLIHCSICRERRQTVVKRKADDHHNQPDTGTDEESLRSGTCAHLRTDSGTLCADSVQR